MGRGAFAGPLVTAGVILKPIENSNPEATTHLFSLQINDSKLVSEKKRKEIKEAVSDFVLFSTVQFVPIEIINKQGIGFANKMGFNLIAQAIQNNFKNHSVYFLTDAFKIPEVPDSKQKNIIRGDSSSISIALASIFAKIARDEYMKTLGLEVQEYGFEKHKGYGTLFHRQMIQKYGASTHHRTDFIERYV